MNNLLLFFALPIAVIIISIALQKIFRNQLLVSGIIFAVFLVATFIIGNLTYLVATIAYTLLAYATAVISEIICRLIRHLNNENMINCSNNSIANNETKVLSITGSPVDNNFEDATYSTMGSERNKHEYRYIRR